MGPRANTQSRHSKGTLLIPNEQGVSLIEFALILPLALLVVFIIIYLALTYNAITSLTQAVTSTRLAITRADPDLVGSALIEDINTYHSSGSMSEDLKQLLASPEFQEEVQDDYEGSYFMDSFGTGDPTLIPAANTYALVYAYQFMRKSIGNSLRYPCDPEGPNGTNCLICRNLNPHTRLAINTSTPQNSPAHPAHPDFNRNFVGISCKFSPGGTLGRLVSVLLSYVSGGGIAPRILVEREAFFQTKD